LLFMGRLSHEKGIGKLFEALSSGALANLDWTAVIAGDDKNYRPMISNTLEFCPHLVYPIEHGEGKAS